MQLLDDAIAPIARAVRNGARNMVGRLMLGLLGCLMAAIGIGFLTSWIFMEISAALGPRTASLLIGLGFTFLAGAFLLVASKRARKAAPVKQADSPPKAPDAASLVSLAAFTAAYVLARYATGAKRG